MTIVGPGGKIPVDTVYDEDTMKYTVHYTPDKAGPVLITVKYAGNEVSQHYQLWILFKTINYL